MKENVVCSYLLKDVLCHFAFLYFSNAHQAFSLFNKKILRILKAFTTVWSLRDQLWTSGRIYFHFMKPSKWSEKEIWLDFSIWYFTPISELGDELLYCHLYCNISNTIFAAQRRTYSRVKHLLWSFFRK